MRDDSHRASCDSGADCVSGICKPSPTPVNQWATQVCMGCDPAQQTCGGGETCGLVEPVAPIYASPVACEPPHGREIAGGERDDRFLDPDVLRHDVAATPERLLVDPVCHGRQHRGCQVAERADARVVDREGGNSGLALGAPGVVLR